MIHRRWLNFTFVGALVVSLGAMATLMFDLRGLARPTTAIAVQPQTLQASAAEASTIEANAAQLAGDYSGAVKLQFTVAGVYSDTLATPPPPAAGTPAPPDLGTIDLALNLSQSGNTLSGYVSLDKTLVFSVEHTIQESGASVKIGPYVNGSFDGTKLTLASEQVDATLGGQPIQRQFRLTGAISTSDGSQISGEYRETLWGAAHQPVTVLGTFTLQRAVFDTSAPDTSNKAPDAVADSAATTPGAAITINVLANDSDANGDPLTITSVSKPQFGAATTNGQNITYTPNAGFAGIDSFSYFVSDGKGNTTAGSVTVTVNGPGGANQSPTAANDNATTGSGVAILIDVLANDADANGDSLSISIDGPPQHGAAVVQNGQILYTPNAEFVGVDIFTYIVSDGKGGTATATVTVTVSGQSGGRTIYLPVVER